MPTATMTVGVTFDEDQMRELREMLARMEAAADRQTAALLQADNNGLTTPLLCAGATTAVAGAALTRRQLLGLAWRRR
jgi:hypothetical protein